MSYSFSINALTKADAKSAVANNFADVVERQPIHAADKDAALAAAGAFIDMLTDPTEDQAINVSMHGSFIWSEPEPKSFTGAGVGISASLVAKPKAD